jgi:hypothetical protein
LPVVTEADARLIPTSAILELRERLVEERLLEGNVPAETQPETESGVGETWIGSPEGRRGGAPEIREFSAPTVAAALAEASAELGVPSEELTYEIRDPGPPRPGAIGSRISK